MRQRWPKYEANMGPCRAIYRAFLRDSCYVRRLFPAENRKDKKTFFVLFMPMDYFPPENIDGVPKYKRGPQGIHSSLLMAIQDDSSSLQEMLVIH